MKLDAVDYIKKPFNVDEFREVLARVMRKKGLARTPGGAAPPGHRRHHPQPAQGEGPDAEADVAAHGAQRLAALADRARRVVRVDLVALQDRDRARVAHPGSVRRVLSGRATARLVGPRGSPAWPVRPSPCHRRTGRHRAQRSVPRKRRFRRTLRGRAPWRALDSSGIGRHSPRRPNPGQDCSFAGVAQSARAGVSYAPGRGFDSLLRHRFLRCFRPVFTLTKHRTNQVVR